VSTYLGAVVPPLIALVSAVAIVSGTELSSLFIPAASSWLLQVLVMTIVSRRSGVSPLYALTAPLGLALIYAMLFDSIIRITTGRGVTCSAASLRLTMIVDAVSDELNAVLADDRSVRLIEEDIYSVLPDVSVAHHYDKRATIYDAVVSTRLYNLVMWGTSSSHYVEFARQALNSSSEGIFLDAGCGSMLFTARTYADSKRRVPEHIRLLQADLNDLPFRQKSFRTIMCLNVLHQIDDAAGLIAGLNKLLSQGGYLYLTSLVSTNRAIGDWYLKALYRTGEFVRPRNELELRELFKAFDRKMSYAEKGNMAFVTMAKLNTA
jgi:hypothetical protein